MEGRAGSFPSPFYSILLDKNSKHIPLIQIITQRVTHNSEITETTARWIYSKCCLILMINCNRKLVSFFSNNWINHLKTNSFQTTTFNLEIVTFSEFQVVFAVLSFDGNPCTRLVKCPIYTTICFSRIFLNLFQSMLLIYNLMFQIQVQLISPRYQLEE